MKNTTETANFEFRFLGPQDSAALSELIALFSRAFDDPENYADNPPSHEWRKRWLGRSECIALAVWHEGHLAGGLFGYELLKPEQERSEIYIYDLAVAEEYRRQGVATRMITHLQAEAKKRGAWVVYVQADEGDDPAMALYRGLGTEERVRHYDFTVE